MPGLRPSEADRLARALLMDQPGELPVMVMGLAYVVDAARQRRPADISGALATLDVTAQAIDRLTQSHGWAAQEPAAGMVHVADAILALPGGPTLGRELLHVTFLASHATSTSALHPEATDVLPTLRAVELGLDAALHNQPRTGATDAGAADLSQAVTAWARAAGDALRQPTVLTQQMTARAAGSVLIAVDAIAHHETDRGRLSPVDYASTIHPSIARSLQAWGEQHRHWMALMSPAERPDPALMAVTLRLRTATDLATGAATPKEPLEASVAALTMVRHVAALSHQAASTPLHAPAESVATMLAATTPHNTVDFHEVWMSLERLEGRAPITVPAPITNHLNSLGAATVRAVDRATRASYLLFGAPPPTHANGPRPSPTPATPATGPRQQHLPR